METQVIESFTHNGKDIDLEVVQDSTGKIRVTAFYKGTRKRVNGVEYISERDVAIDFSTTTGDSIVGALAMQARSDVEKGIYKELEDHA